MGLPRTKSANCCGLLGFTETTQVSGLGAQNVPDGFFSGFGYFIPGTAPRRTHLLDRSIAGRRHFLSDNWPETDWQLLASAWRKRTP